MTKARTANPEPFSTDADLIPLATLSAFVRALESGNHDEFDELDLPLTKHILKTAIDSHPGIVNWVKIKVMNCLPHTSFQERFSDYFITPNSDLHALLGHQLVRDKIEKAINDDDVKQVVFLNPGYDARGFLLSLNQKFKNKNVTFYELDHGLTRQTKLKALLTLPVSNLTLPNLQIEINDNAHVFNQNLYCIDHALITDNLSNSLATVGFKKDKKTLVIVNGITKHLSKEEVKRLLNDINQLIHSNDECLFTIPQDLQSSFLNNTLHYLSKLPKFSLKLDKVIPFISTFGFSVTEKMLPHEVLGQTQAYAGDDNYFILRKESDVKIKLMNEVPDFPLKKTVAEKKCYVM